MPIMFGHVYSFYHLGDYQIKQAKSYIREHFKPSMLNEDEMEFVVELCAAHEDLVRARFASRYCSNKNYITTVQFDSDDDEEPIKGWFCTCSAGARVIGCCAHITALIWHLGVNKGEHHNSEHQLSASRFIQFIHDCIQYHDTVESDDETASSETDSSGDDD